jgi:hypothetical protein
MRMFWVVISSLAFLGCSHVEDGVQVSMITVISNPSNYDGKEVTITGWLDAFAPDDYVLFFSEKHAIYMDTGNAMPVKNEWRSDAGYSLDYCPIGYISITGTISMNDGYPALVDLFRAAFFYDGEGVVDRIGCRQDIGIRGRDFLKEQDMQGGS